jgi:hypothetical protein
MRVHAVGALAALLLAGAAGAQTPPPAPPEPPAKPQPPAARADPGLLILEPQRPLAPVVQPPAPPAAPIAPATAPGAATSGIGIAPQASSSLALQGADVIALSQLVMMELAESARDDLKAIMEGVKAANEGKAGMRETIGGLAARKPSGGASGSLPSPCARADAEAWRACLAEVAAKLGKLPPDRAAEIQPALAAARAEADALSELSTEGQLTLQAAAERRQRLADAISALLRKLAETQASVERNMK